MSWHGSDVARGFVALRDAVAEVLLAERLSAWPALAGTPPSPPARSGC